MGKKRVILIVGYNGIGYHGSQINKEEKTIEKEICDEIAALGYFNPRNCDDYTKTGLQRASRTDKGVHAAMQIISVKIETGPDKSTKHLEMLLRPSLAQSNIKLHSLLETTKGFDAKNKCESRVYEYFVPAGVYRHIGDTKEEEEKRYKLFRESLMKMQGTHNFHNFTLHSQTKGTQRYIHKITIDTVKIGEIDWHRVTIHGQSFMIHQIRKMVGFSLLLAYKQKEDIDIIDKYLEKAFEKDKINIPKAPAPLLLLSHSLFTNYNERYGETHGCIDQSLCTEYKTDVLYPIVCASENIDLFTQWYSFLDKHKEEFAYLD